MNDKSYVTMEQHMCPVCCEVFDTGTILLDKRLKETFNTYTVTGYELCEKHTQLKKDGYVFLIVAKNAADSDVLTLSTADRAGTYIAIKQALADELAIPYNKKEPIVFIDEDTFDFFKKLYQQEEASNEEGISE